MQLGAVGSLLAVYNYFTCCYWFPWWFNPAGDTVTVSFKQQHYYIIIVASIIILFPLQRHFSCVLCLRKYLDKDTKTKYVPLVETLEA